ncbi:MAG: putative sugar nucleotidyl transferase [Planctomycetota bacterium]
MSILLFEDQTVSSLAPITTARAACAVTMGSYRLVDLLRELDMPLVLHLRRHLRTIYGLDFQERQVGDADVPGAGPTLALNARIIPSSKNLEAIGRLLAAEGSASGVVRDGEQIAAVVHPGWTWSEIAEQADQGLSGLLGALSDTADMDESLQLVSLPHEVVAANMKVIGDNLQHRIGSAAFTQQQDGVFLAEGASLGDYVITETDSGPIIIDEGATVGPYTLLRGPIYIGKNCRILEHAAIKDEVSLGHTTKIGGEVEAAVVEPFTNKQHHGFLGHSYLGSWINLGAGTCNSDLKNTYGTVNMEYPTGKSATGMQFLGCVMGDYSKSAINTGIFTGKVIGVCSMMYGFVTSNVPSFVNYARLFGQLATLPAEVMIATQLRMFSRRKVEQRECDKQLLHDMYRLTQSERDRFGDEIAF